jgi:hypothetical protein
MSCATTQLATLKRQTTIPRPIAQLVYMTPDDSVIESVMLQASDKQLPLEAEETPDRTSDQIKAEIEARFGFVPPFFEPATHSLPTSITRCLTYLRKNSLPTFRGSVQCRTA